MKLLKKLLLGTGIMLTALSITSCKKQKVLKSISGEWTIEDIIEDGASIFTSDNVLNKGTINFGDCNEKENKNTECQATLAYDLTILGKDTIFNSVINYKIIEKGDEILFGDLKMDIVTLEDKKCTLTDNENANKYTYKLIKK